MRRLFSLTIKPIHEFTVALVSRLRLQGPWTTVRWLHTVGLAWLTGRISLRFTKITPNIYIGPQYGRYGKVGLEKAGVTATMSLRAEFDDEAHGLSMKEYSYLPTVDNTPPSLKHIEEGVSFIRNVVKRDGIIYVHCGSGVGRAPTMVAAYLIAEGAATDDAIEQIRKVRPFVRVLPSQRERLVEYEDYLRSQAAEVAS
ncbi:MAG: protein-tyrosine phosphatase family protein [Phototrophicaceae bacterium]